MGSAYRSNSFNYDNACSVLCPLWEQHEPSSLEFAVLQESAHAMGIPFQVPDSFYDDAGRIVASPDELVRSMEPGHAYVAYLAPWASNVLLYGTDEQKGIIESIGLGSQRVAPPAQAPEAHDDTDEEIACEPSSYEPAANFPDLDEAIQILETLSERYDASSVERTGVEFALNTLRYIRDSGQESRLRELLQTIHAPVDPAKLARYGLT